MLHYSEFNSDSCIETTAAVFKRVVNESFPCRVVHIKRGALYIEIKQN